MKIAFKTLGCKANRYESDKLKEECEKYWEVTDHKEPADIYIVNTCTVTKIADRKSHQAIKLIRHQNSQAKIMVFGCGVLNKVFKENKEIDKIFKTRAEVFNYLQSLKKETTEKTFKTSATFLNETKKLISRTRAVIKIQDGCNNFCSYCILPYIRGRSVSRPLDEILEEVKEKENQEYKEIVLTGINAGDYRDKEVDLSDLIENIWQKTNIPRLRLSSLEPENFTEKFLNLLGSPRFCAHIHLSLQSGSDQILKKMNRKYTTKLYEEMISLMRKKRPDIAITTDIIVGFPGETEEDFQQSYNFAKKMAFSKIHVFRFSPREGTASAKLKDDVAIKIKLARSKKLIALSEKSRADFFKDQLGKTKEILFESKGKNGLYQGLTDNYLKAEISSQENLINTIKKVRLEEIKEPGVLRGKLFKKF